jgi:hypothetical protein
VGYPPVFKHYPLQLCDEYLCASLTIGINLEVQFMQIILSVVGIALIMTVIGIFMGVMCLWMAFDLDSDPDPKQPGSWFMCVCT